MFKAMIHQATFNVR